MQHARTSPPRESYSQAKRGEGGGYMHPMGPNTFVICIIGLEIGKGANAAIKSSLQITQR